MTGQVLRFGSSVHKVVDAILPWYVNGTLEGEELEGVRRHLRECDLCRREAEWLRELHAACVAAESVPSASNAFRDLRRRLEAPSRDKRLGDSPRVADRSNWTRWALAASIAIAVVGASVLRDTSAPALYRTLGASAGSAQTSGSMIVVFDPATTEAELRRILRSAGARVVDGPTQANAYVLDVPDGERQGALRALRSQRAVVLAEPLVPENAP
jgi:anti-sigma-K factor RskA